MLDEMWVEISTALNALPPGRISRTQVLAILAKHWPHLPGSSKTAMSAEKLGRIENINWQPPALYFEIERHGAQQFGSTRATMIGWTSNIQACTLVCFPIGYRQTEPRAAALYVAPIVESVLASVRSGPFSNQGSDAVAWKGENEFRIIIGQLFSGEGMPKQTLEGRRKRFRRLLTHELAPIGWVPIIGTAGRFRRINR